MNDNLLVLSGDADGILVSAGFDAAMNYALAHNGISPLQWIAIENESENELRDLSIEIKVSGDDEPAVRIGRGRFRSR